MIRETGLVAYLPPFMAGYGELAAALGAMDPEFALIWGAVDRALRNGFIATADGYGLSRFEGLLGIQPSHDDTLDSRRDRIQSRWSMKLPYSMRALEEKLGAACGEGGFVIAGDLEHGYTMTITVSLEMYGQVEELERTIGQMAPVNIVVAIHNSIGCRAEGAAAAGGAVTAMGMHMITDGRRESHLIHGDVAAGGAMIYTEERTITDGNGG